MLFRFFTILFTLHIATCYSQVQDSTGLLSNQVKDTISIQNLTETDSLVEGISQIIQVIEVEKDSFDIRNLKDDEYAASIDEKWYKDLYSTELYDSIYKSVTELTFEDVDYPELHTDTLKARLKELDAKTPFNVEYNRSLESVIKSFLKHRREHLQRLITLSAYYFPMFERELDLYDVPLEIKYLAIVESALKPRARSRVGATGLWQFMFSTGKMYDLDVSSYVDDRSDPIKSTEAAAKYLSRLYGIFDDWDLALAAYNSGPGNVSKAIRRSGGQRNYWNIRHNLPRETAGYLPAFLANMYIFEYAREHGFKRYRPQPTYFETDTVLVKQMITFKQVSEVTGTPIEELQFLNPSYKLDVIPFVKKENYTLRLPVEVIGKFVNNEDEIYKFTEEEFEKQEEAVPKLTEASKSITYRVKSGDYLGKIARLHNVKVSDVKRWNNLRSNHLKIGQRITIFPTNPIVPSTSSSTIQKKPKPISGPVTLYTVQSGDSLWSISQKFSGVSVQNIKDWNGISGSKLKVGMKLKIAKG